MKTFIGRLWLFAACAAPVSCQAPTSGQPFLEGKAEGFQGKHVFLEKIYPDKLELTDSAVIDEEGRFKFFKKPDAYGHYRVRFGGTAQTARMAPHQSIIFLLTHPGEKVRLETKAQDILANCRLEGSPQSQDLMELLRRKRDHDRLSDSLRTALNSFTYAPDFPQRARAADSLYFVSDINLKNLARRMIEKNQDNLVALEALGFLKIEEEFPLFRKTAEALRSKHPTNAFVKILAANVDVKGRTAIGAEAPDIRQPGPDGRMYSLHSFRGKYVLLDFWASWCRPCRAENPTLVNAFGKYKDKGFDIFQVSLDRDKNAWIAAIQQDGLGGWHHVSDLKMWESEPAKLYSVTGIPKSFLLDPNGIIIATDLRGPALEAKLAEVLR